MKKITILIAIIAIGFTSCNSSKYPDLADGLYAEIETTKGNIFLELDYKNTPTTAANFVGLAEGTHPLLADDKKGKPFYDGIIFHRVMENFMIQTGDPLGSGMGDAGYKFDDEIVESLNHNQAGTLAMANSGKNTNGSQFYITHVPYPSLNGGYTVFGKVVIHPEDKKALMAKNLDEKAMQKAIDSVKMVTVDLIAKTPVTKTPQAMNRPVDTIKMNKVQIIRQGSEARAFDAPKVFEEKTTEARLAKEAAEQKRNEITAATLQKFTELKAKATDLPSGLKYIVTKKGDGKKLTANSKVDVYYAVYFADGNLLQTNNLKTAEALDAVNPQMKAAGRYAPMPADLSPDAAMIPGFKEGIQQLSVGDEATLFLPYHLAYGERGSRGIPPKTDLVFEIVVVAEK
ncbi:peptidylprolyl isomerase [Kordia jejudonensis]|uniref:peptidylprolyl isomerase n=1 Tax=Kordia jejudonensis TaxID=1348245 RepID=UPI00062954D6|nr:peptidylprolyl isomerase [Kordia jejudonensis]